MQRRQFNHATAAPQDDGTIFGLLAEIRGAVERDAEPRHGDGRCDFARRRNDPMRQLGKCADVLQRYMETQRRQRPRAQALRIAQLPCDLRETCRDRSLGEDRKEDAMLARRPGLEAREGELLGHGIIMTDAAAGHPVRRAGIESASRSAGDCDLRRLVKPRHDRLRPADVSASARSELRQVLRRPC